MVSRMKFIALPGSCPMQLFVGNSIAFLLLIVFSSQSDAQIFRRLRAKQYEPTPQFIESVVNGGASHHGFADRQDSPFVANQPPVSRLPKWPFKTNYDPRIHRDADAWSQYPKYIGGFHSSHFSNIGLPSGDIGFRGNGLYWTPW